MLQVGPAAKLGKPAGMIAAPDNARLPYLVSNPWCVREQSGKWIDAKEVHCIKGLLV